MPGSTHAINATGKPELILPPNLSAAVVHGFASGGATDVPLAAAPNPPPPPPLPHGPDAILKQIPSAAPQPGPARPAQPGPQQRAPQQAPPPEPSAPTPLPTAPPPPTQALPPATLPSIPSTAPTPKESTPTHILPWMKQAIESGSQALGQALSTAVGLAGGVVPGLGAAGPYISGLVMQGGKIVENVANVAESALVGNVPGSLGTNDRALGQILNPPQQQPAVGRVVNYGGFHGFDRADLIRDLQLKESIDAQALIASHRI
jgi:hypothetical protein